MMVFSSSVSSWGLSTLRAASGPLVGLLPWDDPPAWPEAPVWGLVPARVGEVSGCAPHGPGALLGVDGPQR